VPVVSHSGRPVVVPQEYACIADSVDQAKDDCAGSLSEAVAIGTRTGADAPAIMVPTTPFAPIYGEERRSRYEI